MRYEYKVSKEDFNHLLKQMGDSWVDGSDAYYEYTFWRDYAIEKYSRDYYYNEET